LGNFGRTLGTIEKDSDGNPREGAAS
jgi:hypothetical protein